MLWRRLQAWLTGSVTKEGASEGTHRMETAGLLDRRVLEGGAPVGLHCANAPDSLLPAQ